MNSSYAFLWISRIDLCKRVIFHRVFKNKTESMIQDRNRLIAKMDDKYQATQPYPKPYLEMR